MTGLLPAGQTIVRYISPSGPVLHLSGRPESGREGVWLGQGPEGLGSVDVSAIFEAAARQHGETYVGETMDHGELDLPIHILGDSPDDFRRKRRWVGDLIERKRPGWLVVYTPTDGWSWLQVRKGEFKPAYGQDPGPMRGATFDLLLIAESPLARQANDTDEWTNTARSGKGQLHLYPGSGEWEAWPQFVLRGPGVFRLRWAGNDVTFPKLESNEWALVNSDESRQTIRARNDQGVERNLWPLMPAGQRIPFPAPAREVTRVDVSVSSGSKQSSVWGTVPVKREGLV